MENMKFLWKEKGWMVLARMAPPWHCCSTAACRQMRLIRGGWICQMMQPPDLPRIASTMFLKLLRRVLKAGVCPEPGLVGSLHTHACRLTASEWRRRTRWVWSERLHAVAACRLERGAITACKAWGRLPQQRPMLAMSNVMQAAQADRVQQAMMHE